MSDDQPYYSVEEMPFVSTLDGLEPFSALSDNVALCCPARATFLTGLYSQHTGVERNAHGDRFDPTDTLATWLDAGGYETGLFGKYLNDYPFGSGSGRVPPGWDRWAAFGRSGPEYYDYELNLDGVPQAFEHKRRHYSTDVLARKARTFVESAPEPFFALVAPRGPHENLPRGPATAAPRHEDLYEGVPFPVRPNFGAVAEGAPFFYQQFPSPSLDEEESRWRHQMEALQSVDDLVRAVVTASDTRGRETVVVYLSDNGYSLGSHRWPYKQCGYEECMRLPGLIRSSGDPSGVLASIADLAPTLADFAGVERSPTDGRSLVPELEGGPNDHDRALLLHHQMEPGDQKFGSDLPSFWGLRTHRWKYLRHGFAAGADGDSERPEELYDLEADPFELDNLARDRAHAGVLEDLRGRLQDERSAAPHP